MEINVQDILILLPDINNYTFVNDNVQKNAETLLNNLFLTKLLFCTQTMALVCSQQRYIFLCEKFQNNAHCDHNLPVKHLTKMTLLLICPLKKTEKLSFQVFLQFVC